MYKRILIFSFLFFAFALSVFANPEVSIKDDTAVFFTPPKWKVVGRNNIQIVFVDKSQSANIRVAVYRSLKEDFAKTMYDETMLQMRAQNKEFVLGDRGSGKVDELTAKWFVSSYRQNRLPLMTSTYIIRDKGKVYVIQYTAKRKMYRNILPVFQGFLKSIKF